MKLTAAEHARNMVVRVVKLFPGACFAVFWLGTLCLMSFGLSQLGKVGCFFAYLITFYLPTALKFLVGGAKGIPRFSGGTVGGGILAVCFLGVLNLGALWGLAESEDGTINPREWFFDAAVLGTWFLETGICVTQQREGYPFG